MSDIYILLIGGGGRGGQWIYLTSRTKLKQKLDQTKRAKFYLNMKPTIVRDYTNYLHLFSCSEK